MESGRAFAAGKETGYPGLLSIGINPNPSHKIMQRGSHLHRFLGDIHFGQFLELVIHRWQFAADEIRGSAGRDVQKRPPVGRSATGFDLGGDGPGDDVTGQQLGGAARAFLGLEPVLGFLHRIRGLGCEALRDVIEHKALTLIVE